MNPPSLLEEFFSSPDAKNLKEKELTQNITAALPMDSSVLYDLTFHAAFAKRMFDIIRREGPHTMGFERMQQSFTESVEKVRKILAQLEAENRLAASGLTSPTPEARAKLSRIIEDLAIVKNWLVSHDAL